MWDFNESLSVDIRLLPYDIKTNRAWAAALAKINIITKDELSKLNEGLDEILCEFEAGKFNDACDEDVHTLVERVLTEKLGNLGKKIHTGRSRNDQVLTDLNLYLKDATNELKNNLIALISTTKALAETNKNTFMPSYTHLQQAQPISFAHYILSLAFSLAEDFNRLDDCFKRIDVSPLGCGAVAGSAYNIDREKLAKDLGFSKASNNSISTISNRDHLLELASTLNILMIHLSRYAEDFIIWSSKEFGFIELDDEYATGSSMMPQKKNPDSLELIRGKSARVIGQMQTLFALVKGLPLTYAKDLQEDKPAIFDIIDNTLVSISVFNGVLSTLKINKDKMEASIDDSIFATDLADYLVKKNIPFRQSHEIVAGLVQKSIEENKSLKYFSIDEFKTASNSFDGDVVKIFDFSYSTNLRSAKGGTGIKSINEQLSTLKSFLNH